MNEREFLKAFIEYCNKQGYGSDYDQEAVIVHFLRVHNADPNVICPRCGAIGIPGYDLICCCSPEAISQITDEHSLPLHIRLKPPIDNP